jgi:GNAT superfamily N-acetyltransferase
MTDIEIVPFSDSLKPWFGKLNRVWLERYFVVEDIDRLVLDNPEEYVLAHGGHILFARGGHTVMGTCALMSHGDGNYELTKMAVADAAQGKGVGRLLLNASVDLFRTIGGTRLFLESHHSLGPALKLYETGGFVHTTRPTPSKYQRADVYMVYEG